jgi:hypothetical protein
VAAKLAQYVEQRPDRYPGALSSLAPHDCEALRQFYFQQADSLIRLAPGQILIDSFPLNLARVFPDARFISASRRPHAAVLSGFMQSFLPNSAMANICSLQDAADFNNRIMRIWRASTELLPLSVHVVKYEDVVDDARWPPIYRHARERWHRYAAHLQPIEHTLAPWVAYSGYQTTNPD